ncbi:hypothetical protein [Nocardia carnea]|nr:hypothetical protein [Nocardia carnea]
MITEGRVRAASRGRVDLITGLRRRLEQAGADDAGSVSAVLQELRDSERY